MKALKYGIIGLLVLGLWTSCGTSTSMVGTAGYGYYDDLYYYGHPGYYSGPVFIHERPIILNRIIQVPSKENNRKVIRRQNTRSRAAETNRRQTVSPSQERQIRQGAPVKKRGSSVATPERRSNTSGENRTSSERKPQ